jgi:hypothetical protein
MIFPGTTSFLVFFLETTVFPLGSLQQRGRNRVSEREINRFTQLKDSIVYQGRVGDYTSNPAIRDLVQEIF